MFTGISLGVVVAIIAVIALLGIIASGYVKAPPDTAFIISGLRKKIIIGKSSIKIPFLERLDKLSLKLIPIDVKTEAAVPTADYINIQVDAAVNVKVSSEPEKLKQAAENFLNQNTQYIAQVAREVLEGNMREIVGRMRLEEMVSDRQKFADLVKENAEPDLAAMGLDVVSFNVQNFTDSNGVIDDLGIDNISQIKKKAAIAKAEAEKEIAVAKAEADRQSNDARINSEREIAIKNNELDMQKAELQKNADTKRAEADAAYEIQKEEQRKTIEVTAANANIAKEERLVLLKQREAETMEKSLDAQVKKKAEALIKEKTSYTEVEIENLFVQDLERPLSLEKVKNIIAVSSGKGGVGKSTVAANLAVALAAEGYKVGLVDADIFGPSIPKMFGCEEAQPYMEQIDGKDFIVPVEKYGVKLLSIGFFVDPASATVWRGPMASNALKQMVEQGFWDELDYMLIDLPPGTSDIHLTLVQTVALTGAIVVSTPQQVALADAIKGINMFESPGIQVPVLGLVENMAWFTPAELPDHKYYIFGREGAKQLAEQRGLRLLGEIPVVQSICDGGDAGKPVALNADSITGTAFRQLADEVVKAVEENHDPAKRVRVTRQ